MPARKGGRRAARKGGRRAEVAGAQRWPARKGGLTLGNPAFLFRDLAYVFVAAIAGGLVAWRLRQPIIIGYVLAGILISPLTPGPSVSDVRTLEIFAEVGVILLMFSIGLQFSVKDLLHAKWVALAGGPMGILLMIGAGVGTGHLLGWTANQGIVLGAVICVSSTTVLTRMLSDQGLLHTESGRVVIPLTLLEDLAAVILIVLISGLGRSDGLSLQTELQELARAGVILVPAFFVAAKIIPPLLKRVVRTQSRELFFMVVVAICMGTAALTQAIGLSLALGAFIAGLIISGSDYAHEALAQVFPLRDAFLALFFVTMGLLIDPRTLFSNVSIAGTIIALVIFGKLAVWTVVVRVFGYPIWTALTVALGLTQIGEFSFILVRGARNAGIVGSDFYNATLAASLVTIFMNAALLRFVPAALARRRLAGQLAAHPHAVSRPDGLRNHVVLCGFGRVGSAIGAALETFSVPYIVVELDPDISGMLKTRGVPYIFGDASNSHILHRAEAEHASMLIVTIPDPDRARLAIKNARLLNPKVSVLARAHLRSDCEVLIQAGANEVIQPEMEASATLIRHASSYLRLPDEQIRAYLRGFREAMETIEGKPAISPLDLPEVREVRVEDSAFVGRSLRDSRIRENFGVTVISITRPSGQTLLNPPAEMMIESGDTMRIMGLPEEIDAFVSQVSTQNHKGSPSR